MHDVSLPIMQEGYFEMLEYMTDPKHRSEFEETELECDQKNGKGALCCNRTV
jgi:hypothetical protein